MPQPKPLRLTPTESENDSLFFERRRAARRRASGRVTAVCRDASDPEGPQRLIAMQLQDLSDTGVGATAQEPVSVGSSITLFFPPHGNEPGFDLTGRVVRCRSVDDKHQLGIALSQAGAKLAG